MGRKLNIVLAIFSIWLASKLAVVLSPYNSWHELKCWSLQLVDSWLIVWGIYTVRPYFFQCTAELVKEFPRGTSWETNLKLVELTPQNMSEFFANTPNALEIPWIIRGFMHQEGTDMDLRKYQDVQYLENSINKSQVYNFDSIGEAATITMGEAIDRWRNGASLYLKFNRDFTNNEVELKTAVDSATEILKRMGGPTVAHSLRDHIKVSFFTYGESMRTKIHNAMSANWFYQIIGTKNWKIYEPHQSIYLQPFNFPNAIASASHFNTSFENGPKPIEFTSYAGDFLFFPSFWLHEVDNVGPGPKLAVGLRPSLSATAEMWKTALIPFYEYPKSTTGLAICHIGPSVKIIAENLLSKVRAQYYTRVYGMSEAEAKASFDELDRARGRMWWVKSAYQDKNFVESIGKLAATDEVKDNF